MTQNNTTHRPLWVDVKRVKASTPSVAAHGRSGSSGRKPASVITRRQPKRAPHVGAVRLSAEPAPKFRHMRKISAGLIVIAGGILITTTSTGTVQTPSLALLQARVAPPTFFFDDTENALDEKPLALPTVVPGNSSRPLIPADASSVPAVANVVMPERLPISNLAMIAPPTAEAEFVEVPEIEPVPVPVEPPMAAEDTETTDAITTIVTVKAGDTLSGILYEHGVTTEQMPLLLTDELVKKYLSTLSIGQEFELTNEADGTFESLAVRVAKDRRITIKRAKDDLAIASIDLPVEKERVVTSGTIEQSLYLAAERAKLKQSTIMELADIFQWELDFARDIRKGDEFSLVYDRLYREGKYIGDGDILAAEFVRGGKTYQAIRFTLENGSSGYYSPEGQSKRRTFLRHPVDVVRITSRFDPKRLHPVLHQIRAHKGVDYGAPHGSPIRATADGTIQFAGDKTTYGNTVILQHGQKFSTLYAHMSKISDKSVRGRKVKQGDVIGYVGKSGRVTGTHLHYEFRVNGEHKDPLKMKLPPAQPIAEEYRDELKAISADLIAQMRSVLPAGNQIVGMISNDLE